MSISYTKTSWVNGSQPAINAENLNKIEQGIYDVSVQANANEADIATMQGDIETLKGMSVSGDITISDLLLMSHPVRSLYQSLSDISPATLFGGTWEKLSEGIFIVSAGTNYTAGSTDGEAAHKLTTDEVPPLLITGAEGGYMGYIGGSDPGFTAASGFNTNGTSYYFTTEGGGQAHNNMPPYIAMHTWIRTA